MCVCTGWARKYSGRAQVEIFIIPKLISPPVSHSMPLTHTLQPALCAIHGFVQYKLLLGARRVKHFLVDKNKSSFCEVVQLTQTASI